ncbi:hypothetical protein [Actinospongicola halichondriae]|uniref:hypothetical protein n=1 Tax=Actinospongicola halichondriae TaxID=3236844 RepID=UPI003D3B4C74
MDRLARTAAGVTAAFVALLVVAVVSTERHHPSPPDPTAALVDAWRTSRTATHRSTGTFERVAGDGTRLAAPTEIVQRPPDRLVRGFDEVSGRRDDRVLACPAPLDASPMACTLGQPGPDFAQVVLDEVATFEALVAGDDPLYLVDFGEDEGCWRMERTRNDPRSGYGESAELCFDPATGAMASIRIDHGDIVETTVYDEISADVSDADLEP